MNTPLIINNENQSMQNITLRSHVGTDGNLQLNIPTTLSNIELDVLVFLRPVKSSKSNKSKTKTFSERWQGKFKGIFPSKNHTERDLQFEYLAEHYQL